MITLEEIQIRVDRIVKNKDEKEKQEMTFTLLQQIKDKSPSFVELIPAFIWDCENCGTENTCRSVSIFLSPKNEEDSKQIIAMYGEDKLQEMKEDNGIISCMSYPKKVKCKECKTEYLTVSSQPSNMGDEDASDNEGL